MMAAKTLSDIVNRLPDPTPWSEGDNIPWHDPAFSKRMLKEHLSQEHSAASRIFEVVDQHVDWIHHRLLSGQPTRLLDLGCGPGLYSSRLAVLGHECHGIDYSPASIAYAQEQASREDLACTYLLQDLRTAAYGTGYGLAMQIFGELNVFRPREAKSILRRANHALTIHGLLLLEVHTYAVVQRLGEQAPTWYSSAGGLFSDKPHLRLQESFWEPDGKTATIRHFVIDAATGKVTRYAQSLQAYTKAQYRSLLVECGFDDVEFFPSLTGNEIASEQNLFVVVGRKRGEVV
jgi:SAM-dependent methyltransferase